VQSSDPSFPNLEGYAFTAEAKRAPYLKEILLSLPFALQVVRVLWLPKGGVIAGHFDFDTNFQFGLVRLHIPMQSNPDVEFLISGRRVDMRVGELWYGDFSKPHQVTNRGTKARLHAVVDVEVDDALLALMPSLYLEAQAKIGPISRRRAPFPKTDDLDSFECRFNVPGTILPLLKMGKLAEMIKGATATVRRVGDSLRLYLGDAPHCALSRVSEDDCAIVGLPPGCFFRFRRSSYAPTALALIVRGVQEDLVAARVGVIRGERLAERRIDFNPVPLA
jgi:hypothetical protein